jgi:hypothetical protein
VKTLIRQRDHFRGAELLGPVFRLEKNGRVARCEAWSHQFGQELRLTIDGEDLPRTQVTGTEEISFGSWCEWMELLVSKGWHAPHS